MVPWGICVVLDYLVLCVGNLCMILFVVLVSVLVSCLVVWLFLHVLGIPPCLVCVVVILVFPDHLWCQYMVPKCDLLVVVVLLKCVLRDLRLRRCLEKGSVNSCRCYVVSSGIEVSDVVEVVCDCHEVMVVLRLHVGSESVHGSPMCL